MVDLVPIITIDGPSGSGKGTIAASVAERLGWRILDSGALYRLLGYSVDQAGISFEDVDKIEKIAKNMQVEFVSDQILLDGRDVGNAIRTETAGNNASKVAAIPAVRAALLGWQQDYAQLPGLVADGRDMGTVVFPQAAVKIFLTASAEERAMRRYKQLKEKGIDVTLAGLIAEIEERDKRDRERSTAPLKPAVDAIEIDSTAMSIEAVIDQVMLAASKAFPNITV